MQLRLAPRFPPLFSPLRRRTTSGGGHRPGNEFPGEPRPEICPAIAAGWPGLGPWPRPEALRSPGPPADVVGCGARDLVEDQDQGIVAQAVNPDLDLHGAAQAAIVRLAVAQKEVRALVLVEGPETRPGLGDALGPLEAQLVERGIRIGVALVPKRVDEGVAPKIVAQGQEIVPLLVGDQDLDLLEPLAIALGQFDVRIARRQRRFS